MSTSELDGFSAMDFPPDIDINQHDKKLFYTLDEANKMIPELELAFIRIQQMQVQVQNLFKIIKKQGIDFIPRDNKELFLLYETLDDDSTDIISSLKLLLTNIQEEINSLNERGCNVASLEHGRVNWSSVLSGKEVLLSWHLGEQKITHWCDVDDSSHIRRPISELNHLEELAQV